MAREKKPVHKVQMTDAKRNIIQQLLQEYDIQSAPTLIYVIGISDIIFTIQNSLVYEMW
ncbi:hypothetical protein [Anaerotignum sp.]|uniref:hypothetical protein n=1 Tax=Anaerotignum sp. TaxID=2039241 RepID=UPI00331DFAAA